MTDDREVRAYLGALSDALRDVPREGRAEVLRDVRGHLDEARADEPDVPVRVLLDRLGPPAVVAAEARARYGTVPQRAYGWDVAAVLLVLAGGIVPPFLGWFVGVALLWSGGRWSVRQKLLGTLVLPFGLAFPLFFGALLVTVLPDGEGPLAYATLGALVVAPVVVAAYLLREARRAA